MDLFLLLILSFFLQITSTDTAETAASSKVLKSKILCLQINNGTPQKN